MLLVFFVILEVGVLLFVVVVYTNYVISSLGKTKPKKDVIVDSTKKIGNNYHNLLSEHCIQKNMMKNVICNRFFCIQEPFIIFGILMVQIYKKKLLRNLKIS